MPGDILCTVLGQNVRQGQTILGQARYSTLGIFGAIVLLFFQDKPHTKQKKVHR